MASPTTSTPTPPHSPALHVDRPHGGDEHVHAHHPAQQHHFASMEQQFDSAKMGMWLFLVTEVLLFSGMFVAYTVYRIWHPEVFTVASEFLDWRMGGFNTLVLLASSFTVALSIHFIQKGDNKKSFWMLIATLVGAGIFLVVKYFEYTGKFAEGVFPGQYFAPEGHYEALAAVPYAKQFYSIYFVMTGIHGLHVLIGIGLLSWVAWKVKQRVFDSTYFTYLELAGLYWHLVDIIWIFLFPLLYLIGHGGGGH